ncbi:MAG: glycosyltransferase family 39 protein [Anaerolineae bacterium]
MDKLSRREQEILWLIALPLVAFGLRLYLLGRQSLWYDEGVTWYVSQMSVPDLVRWTAADIQPPLYYLLTWLFGRLIGGSEWALRFPSALFGVLLVPVMWRLARRLFGRETAFITAAIVACAPVMVYYSQEARMYTLLVFEGALAGWLLLRLLHGPDERRSHSPGENSPNLPISQSPNLPALAYVLTLTAALYTHYFALFLLMAHALYFGVYLGRRRFPRRRVGRGLGLGLAIAVLSAPLLPTLLARLGDDPSYWPGALKLDEIGRKVLLSFTLGGAPEMVFEAQAMWQMAVFGLIFFLCLALVFRRRPAHLFFLLLWLVLPLALIVLLSYQTPKFNPRYTLLAWPAFALILGGGIGFDLKQVQRSWLRQGLTLVLFAALAFVAYAWYFSLFNWFADPRFSKADFKHVAQFIRERSKPDETVLLSSGHLFPVWAYYYGWEGWTPLPQMETLDVSRVTDFEIGGVLAQALEGRRGAWLVTWQDEVVDPNGVVPFLLDRAGVRPGDAGDFWGVGLEHWRVEDAAALSIEPPIEYPTSINFADRVELLGFTPLPGSRAEVMLFWRALQPLPDDLQVSLRLLDAEGHLWSQDGAVSRPAAYTFPPSRWRVGQVVPGRQQLPWLIGTPPGEYLLEVGLLDPSGAALEVLDGQGRPQRRAALLSPISNRAAVQPLAGPPALPQDFLAGWDSTVVLRESHPSQVDLQPGQAFDLELFWQAGEFPADDLNLMLQLKDGAGQTHVLGAWPELVPGYPLPAWQPRQLTRGQYSLRVPVEAAPGPADLIVRLVNDDPVWYYEGDFPVNAVEIRAVERSFALPATPDLTVNAAFEDIFTLLGADLARATVKPGEALTVTLYWRAEAPPPVDYTVFAHLLGADERVLVNADHAPPQPTTTWLEGEVVADTFTLRLPPDLAPGRYSLEVGLYDAVDPAYPRLSLAGSDETRLILTTIEVPAS